MEKTMKDIRKAIALAVAAGALVLGSAGAACADANAEAVVVGSPGVLSGNNVQIPIHIPINICGNSVNVLAALNPTAGNTCINA
ncbi:chaplin [Kitasatospora sp. NPDC002227]|uniref:chaplin n=1 Tax=Kitasatospora sp. NPDC002227 TaxID=3154773 RepID=UPI00331F4A5A